MDEYLKSAHCGLKIGSILPERFLELLGYLLTFASFTALGSRFVFI